MKCMQEAISGIIYCLLKHTNPLTFNDLIRNNYKTQKFQCEFLKKSFSVTTKSYKCLSVI